MLDRLRGFDPAREVWMLISPVPIWPLEIPQTVRLALRYARTEVLQVSLTQRARAWRDYMQTTRASLASVLKLLHASRYPPSAARVAQWLALDSAGRTVQALEEVITECIDPTYVIDTLAPPGSLRIEPLDWEGAMCAVYAWLRAGSRSHSA